MGKRKVTLEEAKELLKSDKIFYNGNNKFNVLDVGKYNSWITIEIPQMWTMDEQKKPENPIKYRMVKALTDGMNVDFDGECKVLFGKYRLSKNAKPVFELTEPTKAKEVLIRVDWGGCFNSTRGQNREYANEVGATYFTRSSSNGGGTGYDYWVLPVGFVRDMDPRDVSSILENVENEENERIAKNDEIIAEKDAEVKESIENRDRILRKIEPIIEKIKEYDSKFKYEAGEDIFKYEGGNYCSRKVRYTDELVTKFEEILEKEQTKRAGREEYMPMFEEMKTVVKSLEMSVDFNEKNVYVYKGCNSHSYEYSQKGYNSFIEFLTECQEKMKKEKEEARIKAEELKRETELKNKKEEAKEMGYPENFEFWNRLGGKTNLGHAFVVESNGMIREPDYNNLRNRNHKINNPNWINNSDGHQGYEQILPGEVIVTYTKAFTAAKYVLDVEWADDEITEAQLEEICSRLEKLEDIQGFVQDKEGKDIRNIREWIIDRTKTKAKECKLGLKLKDEEKLAEEILELAEEKNTAEVKSEKAEELVKEFEEKLGENNKKIGDE